MKWVTRARPKIDRIACPWLVSRFIDPNPEFLYVAADKVMDVVRATKAIPFDVPNVQLGHNGGFCSFDAFLSLYELNDSGLRELARIVRAADTGKLELSREAPGLIAVSRGLSIRYSDDHEMLSHGMIVYDALFAWVSSARQGQHV